MIALPERKAVESVEAEVERIRGLFANTLPPDAAKADEAAQLLSGDGASRPYDVPRPPLTAAEPSAALDVVYPNEHYDWAITLNNVHELTQARIASEQRLVEAEERVQRAEARAAEAEHWLRRLHHAVVAGLPAKSA